jgi:peptide/nickel transport system permease protein
MTERSPDTPLSDHYVNQAPFDPYSVEQLTPAQERYYQASQWRIMWWKFKRHRIAVVSGVFLMVIYASIFISEILAPYNLHTRNTSFIHAPPQSVHILHEGELVGPFVYGYKSNLNMETLKREYTPDKKKVMPLRFFCQGDSYRFWDLFEATFHVVCPAENGIFFFFGTDRLGRDI